MHLTKLNSSPLERQTYQCVDVLLLGMYNLEVLDDEGHAVKRSFRFPVLSKPSVYHEPSVNTIAQSAALTEHALHRLDNTGGSGDVMVPIFGPYPEYDQIVAATRWPILTVLMKAYNSMLSLLPKSSLFSLCRNCVK